MNETERGKGRPSINLKERSTSLSNEYYTPEELAKLLKVHYKTILNQIKRGQIKAQKIGSQYRIKKTDFK